MCSSFHSTFCLTFCVNVGVFSHAVCDVRKFDRLENWDILYLYTNKQRALDPPSSLGDDNHTRLSAYAGNVSHMSNSPGYVVSEPVRARQHVGTKILTPT